MEKENDLFLNQLNNLDFTTFDFQRVGLDSSNTSLKSKDKYKKLEYVQSNPLLQTNGKFDEDKFDAVYQMALNNYTMMANNAVAQDIGQHADFFRDNFYAPLEQRSKSLAGPEFSIERTANPMRKSMGMVRNEITDNPLSTREIAQTMQVWDYDKKVWKDSPNDMSLFSNFGQTLVLAQYDEDGTHKDPITGEMVKHRKGDKKLNEFGTYYYETLGGRSAFGREVLSKWDVLTTDGSWINKFDPFDNDGKNSNIFATLVRSAIQVVPAFIPGVNTWYIGARVAMGLADLATTAGKMMVGNDSSLLNNMDGYFSSLSFSSSDYARGGIAGTEDDVKGHPWALENMLNMGADVFLQLAEQRWLFRYGAALFKGKEGAALMNENGEKAAKAQDAFLKRHIEAKRKQNIKVIQQLEKDGVTDLGQFVKAARTMEEYNALYAQQQLRTYLKDYQRIGKYLSMAYMTGITVKDSYGDAIQEGASNLEAALLTLGYAIAEYRLINSDLGRWILPELKSENMRWQQIGKKLTEAGISAEAAGISTTTSSSKLANWAKKIMKVGEQKALQNYEIAGKLNVVGDKLKLTGMAMVSNALGEGVEETSEELLYDLSKTVYNFIHQLNGDSHRLTAWDDVGNRYALSFVGGVIGGGLGQARSEFRNAAALTDMSQKEAFNELIEIVKEHKEDDFLKIINKVKWAPDNLSIKTDENGNYKPLEDNDVSQNDFVKKTITEEVNLIKTILKAEGADLSNESFLKRLTGVNDVETEFRALNLRNSAVALNYVTAYDNLVKNLVENKIRLRELLNPNASDSEQNEEKKRRENDPVLQQQISSLENTIKLQEEELQQFLDGKSPKSIEFMKKVLFETSYVSNKFKNMSLYSYLESKYGKSIDNLTPEELAKGQTEYEELKKQEGAELVDKLFPAFEAVNLKATDLINTFATQHFDKNTAIGELSDYLQKQTTESLEGVSTVGPDAVISAATDAYNANPNNLVANVRPELYFLTKLAEQFSQNPNIPSVIEALKSDDKTYKENIKKLATMLFLDQNVIQGLKQQITDASYINVGVRTQLLNILESINNDYISPGSEYDDDRRNAAIAIDEVIQNINSKPYSPIIEFLDQFSVMDSQKKTMKLSQLFSKLEGRLIEMGKSNSVESFGYEAGEEEALRQAIDNKSGLFAMAEAVLSAARTDNADYGDLWGYNVTVNNLDKESKLATIDANTANVMLQELNQIKDRLQYYKLLIDINSNNRLDEHVKTSVKTQSLIFDKFFKRFVDTDSYPPSNWNGVDELKQELNDVDNFKLLKQLQQGKIQSVSKDKRTDFQKEVKQFQEAIHNFFQKNLDVFETEEGIEKLKELLNPSFTGIYQLDTDILNLNSTTISESAFVWYLATLAAINPTNYMAKYAQMLKDPNNKELILPVAGQEMATMIGFATISNGKVFDTFARAYNKSLQEYADSLDEDEFKKQFSYFDVNGQPDLKQTIGSDSHVSINFKRTVLIEGIAGSGKSSGVAKSIVRMLAINGETQKLLKDVWVVHTSAKNAENFAKALFGENYKDYAKTFLSHSQLMQKISGTNPNTGHSWHEEFDEGNNLVINDEDLEETDELSKYNYGINKTIKKPTLIITDEVSHLSNPSLRMVDEFAEWAGITHLTFGDFDQSGILGKQLGENGLIKQTYYTYSTNFIHCPKLGQSLRSDNRLKDRNNAIIQNKLSELKKNKTISEKAQLYYYEDETTPLIGDKVMSLGVPNGDTPIEQQIRRLLDTIIAEDPNGKLGYIYDDASSQNNITAIIEKLAQEEKYKDRIEFRKGNSAQGFENLYYVINLQTPISEENKIQLARDFYTGLTRARRGSIIIHQGTGITEEFIKSNSILDNSSLAQNIADDSKQKFIDETYQRYKDVYGAFDESLPYIPMSINTSEDSSDVNPSLAEVGTFVTDGLTVYEIVEYKDDKVFLKNSDTGEIIEESLNDFTRYTLVNNVADNNEAGGMNDVNLNVEGDVNNSNPQTTEMIHHSFNVDEYGVTSDGRLGDYAEYRFDNIIGLYKFLGNKIDKDPSNPRLNAVLDDTVLNVLKDTVRVLRSIGRTAKSEFEVLNEIKTLLGTITNRQDLINKIANARFIYKVSQREENLRDQQLSKQGPTIGSFNKAKYLKPENEGVPRIVNDTYQEQKMNDSTISMVIYDNDGNELFEVPIATDTNPFTLAFTKDFGDDGNGVNISKEAKKIRENRSDFSEALEDLEYELKSGKLKTHPQAAKLLEQIRIFKGTQYLPNGGQVIYLKNSEGKWLVPGRDWKNTGITVNAERSETIIEHNRVEYEEEPVSYNTVKNSGLFKLSDNVYISRKNIKITRNGKPLIIKAGHPFVLVTDVLYKYRNATDADLYNALMASKDTDDTSISIVYINPPTKEFPDYLRHLDSVYRRNKKGEIEIYDRSIGTATTSYRVISQLFKSNEQWIKDRMAELYENTEDGKKRLEQDFAIIKQIVQDFDKIRNNKKGVNKNNELINALYTKPLNSTYKNGIVPTSVELTEETMPFIVPKFSQKSTFLGFFDKLTRSLFLGHNVLNEIQFNTVDEVINDNPSRIEEAKQMLSEDQFKYGFFTHVGFSHDEDVERTLGSGNDIIITGNVNVSEVFFNGTINTSALKTTEDEAKAYQKQRATVRTSCSDTDRHSLPDSQLYEGGTNMNQKRKNTILIDITDPSLLLNQQVEDFINYLKTTGNVYSADIIKMIRDQKITDQIKFSEMMTKLGNERVMYKQFIVTQDALRRKATYFADFYRDNDNLIGQTAAGTKYTVDFKVNDSGEIIDFVATEIVPNPPQGKVVDIKNVKAALETKVVNARGEQKDLSAILTPVINGYDLMKYMDHIEDLITELNNKPVKSADFIKRIDMIRNNKLFKDAFNQDLNDFLEYIASRLEDSNPNCKITIV